MDLFYLDHLQSLLRGHEHLFKKKSGIKKVKLLKNFYCNMSLMVKKLIEKLHISGEAD